MGFENCEVGFGKKVNWEMGLVPLPPIPFRILFVELLLYRRNSSVRVGFVLSRTSYFAKHLSKIQIVCFRNTPVKNYGICETKSVQNKDLSIIFSL